MESVLVLFYNMKFRIRNSDSKNKSEQRVIMFQQHTVNKSNNITNIEQCSMNIKALLVKQN